MNYSAGQAIKGKIFMQIKKRVTA